MTKIKVLRVYKNMPRVSQKKSDVPVSHSAPASTASSPAPAPAVSAPAPAVAPAPTVEKKATTRKTFKPLSEETKGKLAEHSKTASKAHIASMRANLLLGKSWDEAHEKATETEKKRANKSA
jgi:hypothetical protein